MKYQNGGLSKVPNLRLSSTRQLTPRVTEFIFDSCGAHELPDVTAGAHVTFVAPSGPKSYSVVVLDDTDSFVAPRHYRFAIQREDEGEGGSVFMHSLTPGTEIEAGLPKNDFPIGGSHPAVLIAGGIGITPLISMASQLLHEGRAVRLHYYARSAEQAAYAQDLVDRFGDIVTFHFDDQPETALSFADLAASFSGEDHAYICGPKPMIEAVSAALEQQGVAHERVHVELFTTATALDGDKEFEIELASTGVVYTVPPRSTIINVLTEAGVDVIFDCQRGDCGICQVDVIEGDPDHRDVVLSEAEKAAGNVMQICVSRVKSARLVLDI